MLLALIGDRSKETNEKTEKFSLGVFLSHYRTGRMDWTDDQKRREEGNSVLTMFSTKAWTKIQKTTL